MTFKRLTELTFASIGVGTVGLGSLFILDTLNEKYQAPIQEVQSVERETTLSPEDLKEYTDQIIKDDIENGYEYDCEDFESQDYAQTYYEWSVSYTGYDYFNLDRDLDGYACESL